MPAPAARGPLLRLRAAALIEWLKAAFVAGAAAGGFAALAPAHADALRAMLARVHLAGRGGAEAVWVARIDGLAHERRHLALVAAAYVGLRVVEGVGLWWGREWSRWLGIGSCAIYLAIEIGYLAHGLGWAGAAAIAVTLSLTWLLWPRPAPVPRDQR